MASTRTFRSLLAISTLALLSACAQGATAKGMTIDPTQIPSRPGPGLAGAVAVADVGGGRETHPLWASKISDASFREALVESLRLVGLLGDGPLSLQVHLVKLDQPILGFNMTVTSVVHYTVKDVRSGATIIDEDVTAEHTATVGDAFYGVTRLRLANEGSARKNIASLIERLNAIRVSSGAPSQM